jgi:hypothetical protein
MAYPTDSGRSRITAEPPPDTPPAVAALVLAYEAELDQVHPGWREYEPFGHLDYDALARVKWLLKRRQLLLHREAAPGGKTRASPRDWKVQIIPSPNNPRMCFAHPIIPQAVRRSITTDPPPVGFALSNPYPTGGSVVPWDNDPDA